MKLARRVILCICVAAMVSCAWLVPIDATASQQVDAGLKRSLASFATARALNAIISVVQGTELAVQPAGIGINLSIGQVLRPVNDLVEQFAHLMLVASVAFGIERVLISIGAHWLVSLTMTLAAIAWSYFYLRHNASPAWVTRILVLLLVTRFAMPIVILGSDLLFQRFMSDDYASSQRVIEATTGQLSSLNVAATQGADGQGAWNTFTGWVAQNANVKDRISSVKQAAEQAIERMVKLMVIFLLQTLLLPIFLLWVLWGIARGTFDIPSGSTHFFSGHVHDSA